MNSYQKFISAMRQFEPESAAATFDAVGDAFVREAATLSDEECKKCFLFLDQAVPVLTRIRNELADKAVPVLSGTRNELADKAVPVLSGARNELAVVKEKEGCEVRVAFQSGCTHWSWDGIVVTADDFKKAFAGVQEPLGAVGPRGEFEMKLEHNFDISQLGKAAVCECYLVFESPADAALVLGLSGLQLSCRLPKNSRTMLVGVVFAAPRHDPKARETGRVIGGLLARTKAIETELLELGFVEDNYGNYALSSNLVDGDCLKEWVVEFKRKRQAGMPRDGMDAKKLKYFNPVPAARLTAKKDRLLVEMDDAWIQLRELQLAGYEFRC